VTPAPPLDVNQVAGGFPLYRSISDNIAWKRNPPLCHPERTQISYFTALPAATYAALRKESRMKSTEATVFDRKSGGAEGPAVRLDAKQRRSLLRHYTPGRLL
jgi:hypothetical protein